MAHSKTRRLIKSKFSSFINALGPGAFVAIGYMDPGNWETSLSAGSMFGYIGLFCILLSNFCAMFLQANAVKLGIITGYDLAQQNRRHFPKALNLIFYVSAELAIIACDIAEVVGSAVALDLLFNVGLVPGMLITALDVFVILLWFDLKRIKPFEMLVFVVVVTIGICFAVLILSAKPDFIELMKGFLPSPKLINDKKMLSLFVAIIGATVMPHNLYLHTYLVQPKFPNKIFKSFNVSNSTTKTEYQCPNTTDYHTLVNVNNTSSSATNLTYSRSELDHCTPHDPLSPHSAPPPIPNNNIAESSFYTNAQQPQPFSSSEEKFAQFNTDTIHGTQLNLGNTSPNIDNTVKPPIYMNETSKKGENNNKIKKHSLSKDRLIDINFEKKLDETLKYLQIDTVFSLTYAFLISTAILVVASAVFSKIDDNKNVDLITAFHDLKKTLGPVVAIFYGIALLLSGQSSTVTGTIAGQAIMCGHLGEQWINFIKPWVRRLITRSLAIIPAVICTVHLGEKSISTLLIFSQIVLSIQLPLAMWPMIWMTSRKDTMTVHFYEKVSVLPTAPSDPLSTQPPKTPTTKNNLLTNITQTVNKYKQKMNPFTNSNSNQNASSSSEPILKDSNTTFNNSFNSKLTDENCTIKIVKEKHYNDGKILMLILFSIGFIITALNVVLLYGELFNRDNV